MKRRHLIIIILFTAFLSTLPFVMFILWFTQPEKELKITIIDKTSITTEGNEHRSLNWILTNEKYCKVNRELYSIDKDYYGFFPLENKKFRIRDFDNHNDSILKKIADRSDMLYVTDTYGVYHKDWYGENERGEYSELIYGGMSQRELDFINLIKKQHKLIISEFNSIATPTKKSVKIQFESSFGLKWTGWTGRFFHDLDTVRNKEIPVWVIRDYKAQHNNEWSFKKAGIVLVNENSQIEILDYEKDLNEEVPHIISSAGIQERFGIPQKIKYSYWFDIMLTKRSNNVLSVYYINTNNKGDSILKALNIPNPFPAVIEHYDKDYKFYYFCGDFSDNPINMIAARFKEITKFNWLFYSTKDLSERESFFWQFYHPLVSTILKNYYSSLSRNKYKNH